MKEASGSISQMASILARVPDDFVVLSGDDAVAIAVDRSRRPRRDLGCFESDPRRDWRVGAAAINGDFERARELQRKYQALMEVNFIETSPGPVKFAHGANGTSRTGMAASDRASASPLRSKRLKRFWSRSACSRECGFESARQPIEELFATSPSQYSDEQKNVFFEFRDLLNRGAIRAAEPDASQPSGWRVNTWVKKGILLGFRIGGIVECRGQYFSTNRPIR